MMTEYDQNNLLKSFPNVELSYETIVHNKVQNASFVLAIPEGRKHFVWFTLFKQQPVCVLMEIGKNKQLCSMGIIKCSFDEKLSCGSGTVFFGTLFRCNGRQFFSVENLMNYKGNNCSALSFENNLDTLLHIFSREIRERSLISFGFPPMSRPYDEMMRIIPTLPYKVFYIQFREKGKRMCFNLSYRSANRVEKRPTVFIVKPDIQNDIYHLYYDNYY
jgi:hypothetical protein